MPGCGTTSTPIRPKQTDAFLPFVTQRLIPGQQSATYLPGRRLIFCHHRSAFRGISSVMGRLCCVADSVSIAITCPCFCSVLIGFYLLSLASVPLCCPTFSTRRRLCR